LHRNDLQTWLNSIVRATKDAGYNCLRHPQLTLFMSDLSAVASDKACGAAR